MKILEKFTQKQAKYDSERQPTIAFLGDSVTHGCFELYVKNEKVATRVEPENGYPEKVRQILRLLYPDVPVTVVNGGVSGNAAYEGLRRLERDVLSYHPDLTVVCFGLNDCFQKEGGLERYRASLRDIFAAIKAQGGETIFMTPNLMTDKAEIPFGDKILDDGVPRTVEISGEGWLSKYLEAGKEEAAAQAVPVCDCNGIWRSFVDNGVNVNHLLSNRVNHPTRDMHWLFAWELVKTMFER